MVPAAGSTVEMVRGSDPDSIVSGPSGQVGRASGSNSTVTVTGTGSAINMEASDSAGNFQIGRDGGTGTVNIQNGGALNILDSSATSGSGLVSPESITVGRELGSVGTLNVDSGSVRIESNSSAILNIGRNGGTGTVNVTGTGTVDIIDNDTVAGSVSVLNIGRNDSGIGIFSIQDQGAVNVESANSDAVVYVGKNTASVGTLTIDGLDASLTINSGSTESSVFSTLQIGRDAGTTGSMTVSGGANAQVTGQNGYIFVGAATSNRPNGGNGALTVTGADSVVSVTGGVVIGASPSATGTSDGGTVTVTDGGKLTANDVWLGTGGILNGDGGTIDANVHVVGGVLAPGNSPGVMNIIGDLNIMSGSSLEMEIGGYLSGEYDVLNVTGNFTIDPTVAIDLKFLDFTPEVGDSFNIFDLFGIDGMVFISDNGGLPIESRLELLTYNAISSRNDDIGLSFDIGGNGGFFLTVESVVSAVPLPPSAILFGTALLGLAGLRRRKRKAA